MEGAHELVEALLAAWSRLQVETPAEMSVVGVRGLEAEKTRCPQSGGPALLSGSIGRSDDDSARQDQDGVNGE